MKRYALFAITKELFIDSDGNLHKFVGDGNQTIQIGKVEPLSKPLPDDELDPFYRTNGLIPFDGAINSAGTLIAA